MTVKQKQWQLFFLGYYGDDLKDIDGIFGEKSAAGTLAFQRDSFRDPIAQDGIFGDSTAEKSMEIIDRIQDILRTVDPNLVDDGLAGPRTMEALKQFQKRRGLPQTGRVDESTWNMLMEQSIPEAPVPEPDTGTFWDHIRYWTREEFRCRCGEYHTPYCSGFPVEPDQTLVELLDDLRGYFGRPGHRSSGIRCRQHNADQPGSAANSKHLYGKAMDFFIEGVSGPQLLARAKADPRTNYAYIIEGQYVHVDVA